MNPPQKNQKPFIPPIELAAAENLSPFFLNTLAALGLEVVIVRLQAGHEAPIHEHAEIWRDLESDLRAIQAGQFDSNFYTPGAQWHFFHVPRADLGRAIQKLKDALQFRELLPVAAILHVQSTSELQEWYPGTAGLISIAEETEA